MQNGHDPISRRGFLLASTSAALLAGCASPSAGPDLSRAPTMTSLLAAQAVPIRNLVPDDPGVAALAKRLSRAQIAGLGAATRGSHEDALLKSVVIQAMAETHDLRVVLLDANRTGCAQLDDYVSGGPTGLLATEVLAQAPLDRDVKTEVIADLLTWMRGWNAVNPDRRVRIFGVDCQACSRDAADALAALSAADSMSADALRGPLTPLLTKEAKAAPNSALLKKMTSAQRAEAEAACRMLESELKRAGFEDAAFTARRAWQGLRAFEHETADGDPSLGGPDYRSRRDAFMAENAVALAAGRPAVFWSQNIQVAGDDIGGQTPSGAALRKALGGNYTVLTQDFAEAAFLTFPSAGADNSAAELARKAQPGSLNALLASASPRTAWFDLGNLRETGLTSEWRKTPISLDWSGGPGGPVEAAPAALFDLLVIHPKLTPSRML